MATYSENGRPKDRYRAYHPTVRNADGAYQLFRIGDAVAGRGVHAAILDAARLCRRI